MKCVGRVRGGMHAESRGDFFFLSVLQPEVEMVFIGGKSILTNLNQDSHSSGCSNTVPKSPCGHS